MSDLIKRLRSEAVNWLASCDDLFDEAADRIDALEAALREITQKRKMDAVAAASMQAIARAALAPERDK